MLLLRVREGKRAEGIELDPAKAVNSMMSKVLEAISPPIAGQKVGPGGVSGGARI
jgi:hypothetical protein